MKGISPLCCYLLCRYNLLLGLTCFARLEGDRVTVLPTWDAVVKHVGRAKSWGVCTFSTVQFKWGFQAFFFEVMVKVTGDLSQGVLQESGVRLLGALWLLCSDLGHLL